MDFEAHLAQEQALLASDMKQLQQEHAHIARALEQPLDNTELNHFTTAIGILNARVSYLSEQNKAFYAEQLLNSLFEASIAPTPPLAMLALTPKPNLTESLELPRLTRLQNQRANTFQLLEKINVQPLIIHDVTCHYREAFQIEIYFKKSPSSAFFNPEHLTFFINLAPSAQQSLLYLLIKQCQQIEVLDAQRQVIGHISASLKNSAPKWLEPFFDSPNPFEHLSHLLHRPNLLAKLRFDLAALKNELKSQSSFSILITLEPGYCFEDALKPEHFVLNSAIIAQLQSHDVRPQKINHKNFYPIDLEKNNLQLFKLTSACRYNPQSGKHVKLKAGQDYQYASGAIIQKKQHHYIRLEDTNTLNETLFMDTLCFEINEPDASSLSFDTQNPCNRANPFLLQKPSPAILCSQCPQDIFERLNLLSMYYHEFEEPKNLIGLLSLLANNVQSVLSTVKTLSLLIEDVNGSFEDELKAGCIIRTRLVKVNINTNHTWPLGKLLLLKSSWLALLNDFAPINLPYRMQFNIQNEGLIL